MNDEHERRWGSWAGWGLGGLVVVYVGFPALWMWPIWKVYSWAVPEWLGYMMMPIGWLAMTVPGYGEWVEWGMRLLGMK